MSTTGSTKTLKAVEETKLSPALPEVKFGDTMGQFLVSDTYDPQFLGLGPNPQIFERILKFEK